MFDSQGVIVTAMATKATVIIIPASNKQPTPEELEAVKLPEAVRVVCSKRAWASPGLDKKTVASLNAELVARNSVG